MFYDTGPWFTSTVIKACLSPRRKAIMIYWCLTTNRQAWCSSNCLRSLLRLRVPYLKKPTLKVIITFAVTYPRVILILRMARSVLWMTVLNFAHFAHLWVNSAHLWVNPAHFWEYSALTDQGMPYLVRVSRHKGPYSQHCIIFLTYEWSNLLEVYYTGLERLTRYKHSSLPGPFIICKNEVL